MVNLHRLAFWALVAFVFAMPWERSVPVPGFGAAGTPLGVIALLLALAAIFAGGRLKLRPPSLLLGLMALFVLWSALTYFWSIVPASTLSRTATYVQLLVMVWLMWQLARTERDFRILLQTFVFGSVFAIGVVSVAFLRGEATVISATTGLTRFSFAGGDPNYFALTLALAIPMAWLLLLRGRNRYLTFLNMAYIVLAVIAIGLSGSRTGAVAAVTALSIIPVTYWHLGLGRKVLLVCALGTSAFGALWIVPDAAFQRLLGTPHDIAGENLAGRQNLWRAGLEFLSQNERAMLIGAGSASFRRAVEPQLQDRAMTAHNTYLSVLLDNGLVGVALLLGLFATAVAPHLTTSSRRSLSLILLLTLAIGVFALSWESAKPFWFVLGILTGQRALVLGSLGSNSQIRVEGTPDPGATSISRVISGTTYEIR